ncbi:MAG: dimethylsulfoniopropionate demethylase [Thiotrichales bacterium]|nr:dimethylsulfoniopropionate demethylase [Thiotrichales bacterium]
MPAPYTLAVSPRLRTTPFHERVLAAGVRAYSVYNHMLLPVMYESLEADYRHLLERVQLWDVAVERQVEIRGRDALALTELMTPRDIGRCAVGQCKYAPVVDENGGVVNDPLILRLADDHFWVSVADSDVLLWAKGIAAGRGFDVDVREPDVSPLALQGPLADDVAEAVFGAWTRTLRFFRFRETEVDGIPVVVARSGWSKQGGFEIYLRDGSRGAALWDRIQAAGEPYGIRAGCPNLIERIESRLVSYGSDVTLDDDPFQAGLESFCDLDKPAEYLARAALAERRGRIPTRRLERVVIAGERIGPNMTRMPLHAGGRPAGFVTSAAYSPRLEKNVALAMVGTQRGADTLRVILADGSEREVAVAGEDWTVRESS